MGYMNHWKRVIGCFLIGGMALTTVGCGGTPAGGEGPSNAAASTSSITDSTADTTRGEPTSTVSANPTGSTGSSSALTTGAAPGVSKAPAGTVPTEGKAPAVATTAPTTASPFRLTDEQWAVMEDFHEAIRRTEALKQIHYRTHTTTLYQNENGEKTTYSKTERWIRAGERCYEEEEYLMNMNPVRTYRRYNEPNISYYTSTDPAHPGDKMEASWCDFPHNTFSISFGRLPHINGAPREDRLYRDDIFDFSEDNGTYTVRYRETGTYGAEGGTDWLLLQDTFEHTMTFRMTKDGYVEYVRREERYLAETIEYPVAGNTLPVNAFQIYEMECMDPGMPVAVEKPDWAKAMDR